MDRGSTTIGEIKYKKNNFASTTPTYTPKYTSTLIRVVGPAHTGDASVSVVLELLKENLALSLSCN